MRDTDTKKDPLPEEFRSEQAAAEFWDTHSISDYQESLEPADVRIDLKRRHFEIEVDEESFVALRRTARRQRKPVKKLASEILKQTLLVSLCHATPVARLSRRTRTAIMRLGLVPLAFAIRVPRIAASFFQCGLARDGPPHDGPLLTASDLPIRVRKAKPIIQPQRNVLQREQVSAPHLPLSSRFFLISRALRAMASPSWRGIFAA
jgi:hypothetical protein